MPIALLKLLATSFLFSFLFLFPISFTWCILFSLNYIMCSVNTPEKLLSFGFCHSYRAISNRKLDFISSKLIADIGKILSTQVRLRNSTYMGGILVMKTVNMSNFFFIFCSSQFYSWDLIVSTVELFLFDRDKFRHVVTFSE